MVKLRLLLPFLYCGSVLAQEIDSTSPQEILNHIDDLYRGDSSPSIMTLKVVTENWTREIELEGWSKGTEQALFRILSPRKEKGTATLKSAKQMWNYLPKVKRVIKVPSSMMNSSWMGSHFSNNDLVKESRMVDDYNFVFGNANTSDEFIVICHPKPDKPIVWGRVVVKVRKIDWMPVEIQYFDEDMKLSRTMEFGDYSKTNGKEHRLPLLIRVTPADEPGEYTEVFYKTIEFNLPLTKNFFLCEIYRNNMHFMDINLEAHLPEKRVRSKCVAKQPGFLCTTTKRKQPDRSLLPMITWT